VREFGDPEPLAERAELNRYLNIGQLATDAQGHLYYAFAYLPEPTVRHMTAWAMRDQDVQYTALEAMPAAQAAARRSRARKQGQQPCSSVILTAVASTGQHGKSGSRCTTRCMHFD